MRVRLICHGTIDGARLPFWREVSDAAGLPRIGDSLSLGVGSGGELELQTRLVTEVRWESTLDFAEVVLADLHPGWLQANRVAMGDAGWILAAAATG